MDAAFAVMFCVSCSDAGKTACRMAVGSISRIGAGRPVIRRHVTGVVTTGCCAAGRHVAGRRLRWRGMKGERAT